MLLRKSIYKTKKFFHKTLRNLRGFLFGGYQKLPKTVPLNPLSSISNDPKMQQLDNFYREFSEQWKSDQDEAMRRKKKSILSMLVKEKKREGNPSNRRSMNYAEQTVMKNTEEGRGGEENKLGNYPEGGEYNVNVGEDPCSPNGNGGGHVIAQKLKELEMMDVHDVDHVLDIEEVLHYYSHLTCPVYLDLVEKFFMDIYSESSFHSPVSINKSKRRLGPEKL